MIYLRDNNGVFEASLDGITWEAVALGTGGVVDHTHAQIDTHIADTGIHGATGTNTHAQIDTHIADTGIHGRPTATRVTTAPTLTTAAYDGRLVVCAYDGTLDLPTPTAAGQSIRISHNTTGLLTVAHHITISGDFDSADDNYGGTAGLTGYGSIYLVFDGVDWIACNSKGTWGGSNPP